MFDRNITYFAANIASSCVQFVFLFVLSVVVSNGIFGEVILLLTIATFMEILVSPGFSKAVFDERIDSRGSEDSITCTLYAHVSVCLIGSLIGVALWGPNLWLSALSVGCFTAIINYSISLNLKHKNWRTLFLYTLIMHLPKLLVLIAIVLVNFNEYDIMLILNYFFYGIFTFGTFILVVKKLDILKIYSLRSHLQNISLSAVNLLVIVAVNLQMKIDILLVSTFYDEDLIGLYLKAVLMSTLFPILSRSLTNIRLALNDYDTIVGMTFRAYGTRFSLCLVIVLLVIYIGIVWLLTVNVYEEIKIFYYFTILALGYVGSIFFNSVESIFYKRGTFYIVINKVIVTVTTILAFLLFHNDVGTFFPMLFVFGKIAGWIYVMRRFKAV